MVGSFLASSLAQFLCRDKLSVGYYPVAKLAGKTLWVKVPNLVDALVSFSLVITGVPQ